LRPIGEQARGYAGSDLELTRANEAFDTEQQAASGLVLVQFLERTRIRRR
jgi:hypothetical protein